MVTRRVIQCFFFVVAAPLSMEIVGDSFPVFTSMERYNENSGNHPKKRHTSGGGGHLWGVLMGCLLGYYVNIARARNDEVASGAAAVERTKRFSVLRCQLNLVVDDRFDGKPVAQWHR